MYALISLRCVTITAPANGPAPRADQAGRDWGWRRLDDPAGLGFEPALGAGAEPAGVQNLTPGP
jgi:hypothetical protein